MTILQLMISIIGAAVLGVLVDRLLEQILQIKSLLSHLIALVVAIFILAYIVARFTQTNLNAEGSDDVIYSDTTQVAVEVMTEPSSFIPPTQTCSRISYIN